MGRGQILPTFFFLGRTVIQLLGPTILLAELALALASAGDVCLFTAPAPAAAVAATTASASNPLVFDAVFFRPVVGFLAWWCCLALTVVTTGSLLMHRLSRSTVLTGR